jgi:hypothetical protein
VIIILRESEREQCSLEIVSETFETVSKREDVRGNQEERPPRMRTISSTGILVICWVARNERNDWERHDGFVDTGSGFGMVTVITDNARRFQIHFQTINVDSATNLRQSVLKIAWITAIHR